MQKSPETYQGYINTLEDAIIIAQACSQNMLPLIHRRLTEKERSQIQCGSVFCFIEEQSGIRRWTDGKYWSPSRIFGSFLIYKELDKKNSWDEDNKEQMFKKGGLIKKTVSVNIGMCQYHVVAYSRHLNMNVDHLTPSKNPLFFNIKVTEDLSLYRKKREDEKWEKRLEEIAFFVLGHKFEILPLEFEHHVKNDYLVQ